MTRSLRGRTAIVGTGRSRVGRVPGRSPLLLAADAARAALADAGLQKTDIDGVLASPALAAPFHALPAVAFERARACRYQGQSRLLLIRYQASNNIVRGVMANLTPRILSDY